MTDINKAADAYRAAVLKRTGLKASELVCPREKSEMTPCLARDGSLAVTERGHCAGCDQHVNYLATKERQK